MTMRSIACLGAGLLGCASTALALAANEVLPALAIVQCAVLPPPDIITRFEVTAVSTSQQVRRVELGASCAREIRDLLGDGFKIQSTFADQSAQVLVYTLMKPKPKK